MPPLIRLLLKWSLIGVAAGWASAGLLLLADLGRLGGLWLRSDQNILRFLVLARSFGVSFAQVSALAAVLFRSDFGGTGECGGDRMACWKADGSAELDDDALLSWTCQGKSIPLLL